MHSYKINKLQSFIALCVIGLTITVGNWAAAIEINDKPMETTITAAPSNIMFVYDNSGSMDWEFMTQDTHDGLFDPNNTEQIFYFIKSLLTKNVCADTC